MKLPQYFKVLLEKNKLEKANKTYVFFLKKLFENCFLNPESKLEAPEVPLELLKPYKLLF